VVNREVQEYLECLGIAAQRIALIPNSIDTGSYAIPTPEEKANTRNRLGIPADRAVFLYVGRLMSIKGIDILLQAWARFQNSTSDSALLVLVGGQANDPAILDQLRELNIQESVSLRGEQQCVGDYYWAADAFVLASRTEGLSNAMLEAMACGLPAIVSNVGGSADVVEHNKSGLIFESEQVDQLTRQFTELMASPPERWQQMGKNARQRVVEYADLDTRVRQRSDLYNELL
jgi:glycosyltransferase involved in cell wall biosynthesis